MRKLINALKEASAAYYTGNPIMSDADYDKMYEHLKAMENESGVVYSDSPTITVGSSPVDFIAKINHDHPMLSLDKVHTGNEIIKFMNDTIVGMFKADGLTVSATYDNGVLKMLETRGDGEVGNDILFHAYSFCNLPLHINKTGKYVIDGEAIILYDDFEEINKQLPEQEKKSNPRNLAAGTLNQLDPNVSRKRKLRFYAWDVIEGGSSNSLNVNLFEAEKLGFDTVPHFLITLEDDITQMPRFLNFMRTLSREMSFPIDGVVFKYDDIIYGKSLGSTGHHPRNAIAYKYEDDKYPTKVKDVEWTVGKTGQIVPTLVTEPVEIDGTMVNRASMHNISIFKQLHPKKNATAYLYKANAIIPQCDSIDPDGDGEFNIPDTCPVCGCETTIVKTDNTEILVCTNPSCKGKLLGKLNTFVSKKGFDIKGLSEQTLSKFIELGWVNSFKDIFELKNHKKYLMNLEGFGTTSVNKLLKAIDDSRHNVDPRNFIVALSIPGIGEGQAKSIIRKYKTFDSFICAINSWINIDVEGIGDVLNRNIFEWYENTYRNDNIDDLLSYIDFKTEVSETKNNLSGMTFVVTGSVNKFKNRKELENVINSYGGKVAGSVSKNTNYLINNDNTSTSSKNIKAMELKIPIITEDEFLDMVKKYE